MVRKLEGESGDCGLMKLREARLFFFPPQRGNFLNFFFTLQYCIGFAIHQHASATGVHVFPILNATPPPSPYHPSGSSQCTSPKLPVSCIEPGLEIHFLYDIIHVLMPISQIIPPFPLPQSPKDCSIHLCLFCCLAHRAVVTIFLNSIYIYTLVYCIGVFLSGLLHSV